MLLPSTCQVPLHVIASGNAHLILSPTESGNQKEEHPTVPSINFFDVNASARQEAVPAFSFFDKRHFCLNSLILILVTAVPLSVFQHGQGS